jgi:hypothetical protein
LPPQARDVLRAWLSGDGRPRPDAASARAHARLLGEFVQHHVAEGVELRAFAAWTVRFR